MKAKVIYNKEIAEDIFEMLLKPEAEINSILPGQFIHILLPGKDTILRRPISINMADERGITIVYNAVGKGTKELSCIAEGLHLDFTGPLGNGYSAEGANAVFLVGGGMGVAPLRYAAHVLKDKKVTAFLGFRSETCCYHMEHMKEECQSIEVCSDDGTVGQKGFVTQLLQKCLEREKPDLILACGPTPMLKALKDVIKDMDIKCQVSLEQRMGCGVGACRACVVQTTRKETPYLRVCHDGPVFCIKEVEL